MRKKGVDVINDIRHFSIVKYGCVQNITRNKTHLQKQGWDICFFAFVYRIVGGTDNFFPL